MLREIIESGFKVSVPEDTSFRLCENPAYQKLSGLSLKEMDVGWWDSDNVRLIFLELKGVEIWEKYDSSKDTAHSHLMSSLKGKATDVLLMLAAMWIETDIGRDLKAFMPKDAHKYHGDNSLKLIFLIDTPFSRRSLLLPVKDDINRQLAGCARLFGMKNISIIDLEIAKNMGLPVTRET